jgi:hypothetical protein
MRQERRERDRERREDDRGDRAFALLYSPLGRRFILALDVCGWKLVRQDGSDHQKWLVPYWSKAKHWPSWCEDLREKPSPKLRLRLIDGGKPPDDGGDDGGGGSR